MTLKSFFSYYCYTFGDHDGQGVKRLLFVLPDAVCTKRFGVSLVVDVCCGMNEMPWLCGIFIFLVNLTTKGVLPHIALGGWWCPSGHPSNKKVPFAVVACYGHSVVTTVFLFRCGSTCRLNTTQTVLRRWVHSEIPEHLDPASCLQRFRNILRHKVEMPRFDSGKMPSARSILTALKVDSIILFAGRSMSNKGWSLRYV